MLCRYVLLLEELLSPYGVFLSLSTFPDLLSDSTTDSTSVRETGLQKNIQTSENDTRRSMSTPATPKESAKSQLQIATPFDSIFILNTADP